jgi:hypothetical protein
LYLLIFQLEIVIFAGHLGHLVNMSYVGTETCLMLPLFSSHQI